MAIFIINATKLTVIGYESTVMIVIVIKPLGESLAFAKRSKLTNISIKSRKKPIAKKIVVVIIYQISIPIKLIKAMPMRPVIIYVMPKPCNGAGTFE